MILLNSVLLRTLGHQSQTSVLMSTHVYRPTVTLWHIPHKFKRIQK